ncbi:hypothetical protein J2Y54_000442 [Sphingomonas sp. BE123]|jgi:hypothetical protein|uniref:hypothetical protein n=1 Tax=unclassified Sphingomonas TaxID=196159 RepID=UPI00285FA48F|nr:hypothetical protein [Sphingomonas sp. BE123]MDR6850949.1 hypothetical protein [Sphingomonas sp. BE123]
MGQARQPHRLSGIASAEAGLVLLDGPAGVAIAMTPDAAEETARSLRRAAAEARGQRPAAPGPESSAH